MSGQVEPEELAISVAVQEEMELLIQSGAAEAEAAVLLILTRHYVQMSSILKVTGKETAISQYQWWNDEIRFFKKIVKMFK